MKRLGVLDQLVRDQKPASRPAWLTPEAYALLPAELLVRELRYRVTRGGFRTEEVTLITSLLNPTRYPESALKDLYGKRWRIETDLRDLKQTLGADVLRCGTVEGVGRELLTFALVYNLVRELMLEASERQGCEPRDLMFIDALDILRESPGVRDLLFILLKDHRPGRSAPRTIKRPEGPVQLRDGDARGVPGQDQRSGAESGLTPRRSSLAPSRTDTLANPEVVRRRLNTADPTLPVRHLRLHLGPSGSTCISHPVNPPLKIQNSSCFSLGLMDYIGFIGGTTEKEVRKEVMETTLSCQRTVRSLLSLLAVCGACGVHAASLTATLIPGTTPAAGISGTLTLSDLAGPGGGIRMHFELSAIAPITDPGLITGFGFDLLQPLLKADGSSVGISDFTFSDFSSVNLEVAAANSNVNFNGTGHSFDFLRGVGDATTNQKGFAPRL